MARFWQVGGSVRDELMSLPSKDIDYAVEAQSFGEMREAVQALGYEIFLETPKYFTLRARGPEGAADFTLCRKDGAYQDGRHPDTVEVGTIREDLARRDFTMNAIAKGADGTLLDPYGGQQDIKDLYLRCVGITEDRFTEDGLRMLRALRFAVTKGLVISDDIQECLLAKSFFEPRLKGVSAERVREELYRMFRHDTDLSLEMLERFASLRSFLFYKAPIWLRPTLEVR